MMVFEDFSSLVSETWDQQSPDLGHTTHSVSSLQQPDQHSSKSSAEDMAAGGGGGGGVLTGGMLGGGQGGVGCGKHDGMKSGVGGVTSGMKSVKSGVNCVYCATSGVCDGVVDTGGVVRRGSASVVKDCASVVGVTDECVNAGCVCDTKADHASSEADLECIKSVILSTPINEEKVLNKKRIWRTSKQLSEKDGGSVSGGFSLFTRKSKSSNSDDISADVSTSKEGSGPCINAAVNSVSDGRDVNDVSIVSSSQSVVSDADPAPPPTRSRLGSIASALGGAAKFTKASREQKNKDRDKENRDVSWGKAIKDQSRGKTQGPGAGCVGQEVLLEVSNVPSINSPATADNPPTKRRKSSYPTFKGLKNKSQSKIESKSISAKQPSNVSDNGLVNDPRVLGTAGEMSLATKNSNEICSNDKKTTEKHRNSRLISLPKTFREWRLRSAEGRVSKVAADASAKSGRQQEKWADGISKQYKQQTFESPKPSVCINNQMKRTPVISCNSFNKTVCRIENSAVIRNLSPIEYNSKLPNSVPFSSLSNIRQTGEMVATEFQSIDELSLASTSRPQISTPIVGNDALYDNPHISTPDLHNKLCKLEDMIKDISKSLHVLPRCDSEASYQDRVVTQNKEGRCLRGFADAQLVSQLYSDVPSSSVHCSSMENLHFSAGEGGSYLTPRGTLDTESSERANNVSFHSSYLDLYVSPRGQLMPLSETQQSNYDSRNHDTALSTRGVSSLDASPSSSAATIIRVAQDDSAVQVAMSSSQGRSVVPLSTDTDATNSALSVVHDDESSDAGVSQAVSSVSGAAETGSRRVCYSTLNCPSVGDNLSTSLSIIGNYYDDCSISLSDLTLLSPSACDSASTIEQQANGACFPTTNGACLVTASVGCDDVMWCHAPRRCVSCSCLVQLSRSQGT